MSRLVSCCMNKNMNLAFFQSYNIHHKKEIVKLSNKRIVIVYLSNEKEQMKREEHICIISCITDETVTDITDENVTNDEAGMLAARAAGV